MVLAQGVSELVSIFITTSMALLTPTVAWWLENSKEARACARPSCSARLGSIRSAREHRRRARRQQGPQVRLAATPRAPRPTLAHKINCVRSLPPGREQQERDATRGWRVSGQHAPPRCRHAAGLRRPLGRARPMAMSPAAIVRSWVLGISSNLQPQPLPWLAYFGLDGAHDLI